MRITVTGADGMLGRAVMSELDRWELTPLTEPTFKLEDREGAVKAITESNPEWVVHTAAMTNVDGCERDLAQAYRINALGTRNVALGCAACGAGLLYVSTDFVFGRGHHTSPIEAWELPAPLSIYGRSKYGGERYAEALAPKHIIARTAWLYGRGGAHFVGAILHRAREGKPLRIVDDQRGSPSFADDVAVGIACLLEGGVPGWYHLVNEGSATWFEFAKAALAMMGFDSGVIVPCSTTALNRPAPRPAYSVLSTFTYTETTGHAIRSWESALEVFLEGEKA